MENKIKNWKLQADALLLMSEMHDEKYRRTHKKPETAITFPDGRWESEGMRKSRINNKEIKQITKESLLDSPFLCLPS